MRILIVADAFPPRCGGSGWSTFHLVRALRDAGHDLSVVKPQPGLRDVRQRLYENVEVTEFGFTLHDLPYLRNLQRDEVLHRRLRDFLIREQRRRPVELIHAQHVLGSPASVAAGEALNIPAVVTVRDYWPICYFTTWHVRGEKCPECSFVKMLDCMREKHPRMYWAGVPMMGYMRRNIRRKQQWLRRASAVVAVSRYVGDEVVKPIVGADRSHVIPNTIDAGEVDRAVASAPAVALPERFVLFVGKLNRWKGSEFVLDVAARLPKDLSLVIAGDGPERGAMEVRARTEGMNVRFLPWLDNPEVLRVMKRAGLVVVPSLWPEPLSRVVLEAMAVGAVVLASDTGGIHDQLEHDRTGLVLPLDSSAFAQSIVTLIDDGSRKRRMVEAARTHLRASFEPSAVLPRVEALYRNVVRSLAPKEPARPSAP